MTGHYEITDFGDQRPSMAYERSSIPGNKPGFTSSGYETVANPVPFHRNSFWQRTVAKLGRWQIAILVGGNIGLIGAMVLLRYLWPWASRGNSNTWEAIVFSGWILRTITLISIVIRTCMAMQATVFCMVVAGISLQRSQVLLRDVAVVSIFRFSNSGPHNMILPLFRASRGWKSFVAIFVTGLLSITTIASQFTSTLLLIDIGTQNLEMKPGTYNVAYGGNITQKYEFWTSSTANSWDDRPATLPAFAEMGGKNIQLSGHRNGGAGFATGSNIRALLPLDKQDRVSIAKYKGPAALVDSRVVCVSPKIESLTVGREKDGADIVIISGEVYPDALDDYYKELEDLEFFSSKPGNLTTKITFNCKAPSVFDPGNGARTFDEWKVSLCQLYGTTMLAGDDTGDFFSTLRFSFVVLNMTGTNQAWYDGPINETSIGFGKGGDGEWVKFSYPASDKAGPRDLSLSICFTGFNVANGVVTTRADWNLTEPILSKSLNSPRYNTTSMRLQLGVEKNDTANLDYKRRGILELVDFDEEATSDLTPSTTWIEESLVPSTFVPEYFNYNSPTARMCIWCDVDLQVHEGFIALFQDTLTATNHPALALQALLTARTLQIYEDRRPDFSISANATVSMVRPFQIPTAFRGLIVVFSLVVFHALLMIYTVVLFFRLDGHTSLGQAWQTVAQLHNEETKEVMAVAATTSDLQVKKWLASKGDNRSRFGIHEGRIARVGGARSMSGLRGDLPTGEESEAPRSRSILSFRAT